jgi:hypothetical protein
VYDPLGKTLRLGPWRPTLKPPEAVDPFETVVPANGPTVSQFTPLDVPLAVAENVVGDGVVKVTTWLDGTDVPGL